MSGGGGVREEGGGVNFVILTFAALCGDIRCFSGAMCLELL